MQILPFPLQPYKFNSEAANMRPAQRIPYARIQDVRICKSPWFFVFAGTLEPISYAIIAETPSVRLRALSTGVGCAAYYVAEIPMIYLASQMLNPTGSNLAGKSGYVWGGTAIVCWIMAFFFLPELKHRSYREADILFNRKIATRKFKSTNIDIKDNE